MAVQRPVQQAVQHSVCTQRTVAVVKVNPFWLRDGLAVPGFGAQKAGLGRVVKAGCGAVSGLA